MPNNEDYDMAAPGLIEALAGTPEHIMWHFHQDSKDGVIYLVGPLETTPLCPDPRRPIIVDEKRNEGHCVRLIAENITLVKSTDSEGFPRPGDDN